MKNYLFISLLCFTICSFGQDEKPITQGHFLVGGGFFGDYEDNRPKVTQLIASPNFGYFVINNMAIGIMIGPPFITISIKEIFVSVISGVVVAAV